MLAIEQWMWQFLFECKQKCHLRRNVQIKWKKIKTIWLKQKKRSKTNSTEEVIRYCLLAICHVWISSENFYNFLFVFIQIYFDSIGITLQTTVFFFLAWNWIKSSIWIFAMQIFNAYTKTTWFHFPLNPIAEKIMCNKLIRIYLLKKIKLWPLNHLHS